MWPQEFVHCATVYTHTTRQHNHHDNKTQNNAGYMYYVFVKTKSFLCSLDSAACARMIWETHSLCVSNVPSCVGDSSVMMREWTRLVFYIFAFLDKKKTLYINSCVRYYKQQIADCVRRVCVCCVCLCWSSSGQNCIAIDALCCYLQKAYLGLVIVLWYPEIVSLYIYFFTYCILTVYISLSLFIMHKYNIC